MRRLAVIAVWSLTAHLGAQQPPPAFDVASVKPSAQAAGAGFGGSGVNVRPGGAFSATNYSVVQLMRFAYNLFDDQIIGGPDWIRAERFNVTARAATEVPRDELRRMVQTLLADRFKLRLRNDTRDMSVLELLLVRNDGGVGPNLHNCANEKDQGGRSTPEKPFVAPAGGAVAAGDCSNLASLVGLASSQLQGIVVNRTGLVGDWRYNIYFDPQLSVDAVNSNLPSFIGALREQLGLKLERTRGPVSVLVIESVERPTLD